MDPFAGIKASISGFRGIVGEALTPDLVLKLAAAFSSLLQDGPLVLGRDSRPSGEAFSLAARAGILATGRDIREVGIVPTPTVGLYAREIGAAGGVVITASHNPVEWNALKFFGPDGLFIPEDLIHAIQKRVAGNSIPWVAATKMGALTSDPEAEGAHMNKVLSGIDSDLVRKAGLKVVVDGCRGAGSRLGPRLLRKMGCEVVELDCVPDGKFTRQLEPTPKALVTLAARVKAEGAAVGFALDPDADRLALVDDTGTALSEELTLALAADHVLSKTPGPLVANLSSTGLLDRIAEKHGVNMVRTKIGEMHVTAGIFAHHAPVGGEGNGGVIVPAIHPGRDAATGMALIVEMLATRGQMLSAIVAGYPPVQMVKDKVSVEGLDVAAVLAAMREAYADARQNDLDGIRIDWEDRWLHVRASNTEPILRLIAEAPDTEQARELVEGFREKVLG